MKRITRVSALLLLAIMSMLSFGINAFANVTQDQALAIAQKLVPGCCKVTEVSRHEKDLEWECEFLTKNKKAEYEVVVDETTGKVKKLEMEMKHDKGGCRVSINKCKAKKSVLKKFQNAVITKVKKCKDDGFYIYRVWFHGDGYTADAEVNAKTGKVNEWTLRFI